VRWLSWVIIVREGVGTHGTIKKFEEIEQDFFSEKHWKE